MNLLLDTNIFLEVLLGQDSAESAAQVLKNSGKHVLYISDFSLHSIGVLLFRRQQSGAYLAFVGDIDTIGIRVRSLRYQDHVALAEAAASFRLDFDDAYQYEVARRFDLTIVSFDSDFKRTDRGYIPPDEVSRSV